MIKGLESSLKPFLTRIQLADDYLSNNNKSQLELYGSYFEKNNEDNPDLQLQETEYKLDLTLDFSIKAGFKKSTNVMIENDLKNSLNISKLNVVMIGSKASFLTFLSYSEQGQIEYLKNFKDPVSGFVGGQQLFNTSLNINDYIQLEGDSPEGLLNQRVLTVPTQINKKYSANINKNSKNPNFLACIYFLTVGAGSIIPNSIGSEIIFNDGRIVDRSGYFTIGETYSYLGTETELTNAADEVNKTFIDEKFNSLEVSETYMFDPVTGESLNPSVPTDRNKQVNYLFGSPGDVWVGPVHLHPVTNESDPNFGKARVMAGATHDSSIPHPFLEYNVKGNSKVIDFRSIGSFEDAFSYKSTNFERILASTSEVIYKGKKSDFYVDDVVDKSPIFSKLKYSIRPVTKQKLNSENKTIGEKTKDNIVIFFSIDKRSLLRQSTKAPELLEKLSSINPSFYDRLTKDIDIFHFEIIRKDLKNNTSMSLITGNNDQTFNDFASVDNLGNNTSKGFSFIKRTNALSIERVDSSGNIDFYEFTDGEIDAYKDMGRYSYEINIKFKDPMITYLTLRLQELNEIIQDLSELFEKTGFMIKDSNSGKFVTVYDRFKKQLNTIFVQQSLNPPSKPLIPLDFNFDAADELPSSVNKYVNDGPISFIEAAPYDNLMIYILAIKLFPLKQLGQFNHFFDLKRTELVRFIHYVRSSLRLSTTTPVLIQKVISLMEVARDRTEKLLSLYSTEQIVKKSVSFTTQDYLKSTGNIDNSETYVIELQHSFKNDIDLSKTKDYFNWIEEAPHTSGFPGGLKNISVESYKSLVQNPNIINFLKPAGVEQFADEGLFSYSFLPYAAPSTLEFNKSNKIELTTNYLQTIRKKIIHNITNTPDSVLVPEILSTFGIKFGLSTKSQLEYINDQTYKEGKKIQLNNSTEDNFGSEFSLQPKPISGFNEYSFVNVKAPAFGSVEDPDYAWQGGNYNDYPYSTAISLVNLINTNVYDRRSIEYLKTKHLYVQGQSDNPDPENIPNSSFFAPKFIPYAINLFSTNQMSDPTSVSNFCSGIPLALFTDLEENNNVSVVGDALRFTSYAYYSYLLNIFGRVYYLRGFNQRREDAFGGEKFKFSPTTITNDYFIKDMDWAPLSLEVLNALPAQKRLLCKVAFFAGDEIRRAPEMIDQKIVDLYKDYYNYNQMFYISNGFGLASGGPSSIGDREVVTPSLARETRSTLNSNIVAIDREIMKQESIQDPEFKKLKKVKKEAGARAAKSARQLEELTERKPRRS